MDRLKELGDRYFAAFERQSDVRRAAILGGCFGVLLFVIVMLICLVLAPLMSM